MDSTISTIARLSERNLRYDDRRIALKKFATLTGWHPSDEIFDYGDTGEFTTGHLLVEHGLDHTAVISFLAADTPFEALSIPQQNEILGLSYNNMVDWHLFPDRHGLLRVYNRSKPFRTEYTRVVDDSDVYRAEAFDRIVGRKNNPNILALDDALLSTVSRWRRILASDLSMTNDSTPIAELFNAIFFIRAIEDDKTNNLSSGGLLLDQVRSNPEATVRSHIELRLIGYMNDNYLDPLIDVNLLSAFDLLESETAYTMFSDFYQNRHAPYKYDFSVMSGTCQPHMDS